MFLRQFVNPGCFPGWIRVCCSSIYKYKHAIGTTTTPCCRLRSLSGPPTSTKTQECSKQSTSSFKGTAAKADLSVVIAVGVLVVGAGTALFAYLSRETEETSKRASTGKRDDIDWDDYFMAIAFLSSQWSKDPKMQVVACIVNQQNKIVGTGYSGMPDRCPYDHKCHAEMNAVLNKNSFDVTDCVMYVSLFPCKRCAKILIEAGIEEVVYYSDKSNHQSEVKASKEMFDEAGVSYRQYTPKKNPIIINFDSINVMPDTGL